MKLSSNQFKTFKQYILNTIPESLQLLFNKIKLKHYAELYELEADINASLSEDLNEILATLCHNDRQLSHRRYLWMTLILTLAVEPTLEYYDSSNLLPKKIINMIIFCLQNIMNNPIIQHDIPNVVIDNLISEVFNNHESYFNQKGADLQEISEALDVFYNAIKVLNFDQAIESLLVILDDCLEGYAIFPGSYGRRELFDWWLLEVVPASWYLLPPKSFYVVEGLQNQEEIKLRQTCLLEKISSQIWYPLLKEIGDNQGSKYSIISNPHIPFPKSNNHKDVRINWGIDFNWRTNNQIINLPENKLSVCFV